MTARGKTTLKFTQRSPPSPGSKVPTGTGQNPSSAKDFLLYWQPFDLNYIGYHRAIAPSNRKRANPMKHRLLTAITTGLLMTTSISIIPMIANASPLANTFPALQGIELTSTQEQQLTELSNQTLTEVRSVLSPQQRVKFDRSLAKGVGLKKSLMATGLTLSQQLKLRNILAPKQQQLEAILTPAQQQQARNNVNAQR
jgi:Spy/CpxP family protein refolding chaperone